MKKVIKILIPVFILIGELIMPKNSRKTDSIIIKKYRYSGGMWHTDKNSYKNRLVLTGKLPKATEPITFIVLSDRRDVDFLDVSEDIFKNGKREKEYILTEIRK